LLVKKLAGAFNIVGGLWLVYIGHGTSVSGSGAYPAPAFVPVIIIGLILIADSIPCFFQLWVGFLTGIVLALAAIVLIPWQSWAPDQIEIHVITFALPAIAIVLNAIAALSKKRPSLSEENHPLNLPVFG
jgi:hypothetical protein